MVSISGIASKHSSAMNPQHSGLAAVKITSKEKKEEKSNTNYTNKQN